MNTASWPAWNISIAGSLAATALLYPGSGALAQSLAVNPVNIQLGSGQMTSQMTVVNQGDVATAVQIRVFAWHQKDGVDELSPSDDMLVSPPLAMIGPGGTQIVRLVLRKPVVDKEQTYRMLLDQIPPAAQPGIVRVALRMSLPVFAQPTTRVNPKITFHIERAPSDSYLVAVNEGSRHDAVRNLKLSTENGDLLKLDDAQPPYVLAGSIHRWRIVMAGALIGTSGPLRLTATTDSAGFTRFAVAIRPKP